MQRKQQYPQRRTRRRREQRRVLGRRPGRRGVQQRLGRVLVERQRQRQRLGIRRLGIERGGNLDAAASSSGSGGGDGATTLEGGTATDASSSVDGSSEGGAGPGADGGFATDGSASEAGGSNGLACGRLTCMAPGQTCCATFSGNGTATSCVNTPLCPVPGSTALHCTSTADCSGQTVCCLTRQATGTGSVAECRTSCSNNGAQLCDPTAPDPGCQQGQRCQPPNGGAPPLPSGVGECGG